MPTENFWSSTSSAPIQTTATRSSPNSSRCSTANSSSSLRVARSAFIVSTTRLVKRDCRSAWALNSLMACTPRSDSRKWLDCLRLVHQLLFGGVAQRLEEGPAQQRVQRHRGQHHRRQRAAVDEHHGQRQHHQQAVEHGLDEAGGQRLLDLLHGREARPDVADVALLEPLHRQAHQVREDVGQPLQVERGRQHQHRPGADAPPCRPGSAPAAQSRCPAWPAGRGRR